MRPRFPAGALCAVALALIPALAAAQATALQNIPRASEPPIQSGVYGFSGARVGDGNPQGFIGECISIFDSGDKREITHAQCYENSPGAFRVALKPGHYMLHGPGGVKAIDVKQGAWIKIESIVPLPMAP